MEFSVFGNFEKFWNFLENFGNLRKFGNFKIILKNLRQFGKNVQF